MMLAFCYTSVMGKAEIIRELAQLSPQELAEIRARLDELAQHGPSGNSNAPALNPTTTAHVRSPRLADRTKLRDFAKQVTELRPDA